MCAICQLTLLSEFSASFNGKYNVRLGSQYVAMPHRACREDYPSDAAKRQGATGAMQHYCEPSLSTYRALKSCHTSRAPSYLLKHHLLVMDLCVSCLCSISSGVSEVPRHVVPPLTRLSYSVLMWAWQLASGGVATTRCCLVTKQLLRQSPSLLVSVLELFASETEGMVVAIRPRKTIVCH